jgi:hypothetical protein
LICPQQEENYPDVDIVPIRTPQRMNGLLHLPENYTGWENVIVSQPTGKMLRKHNHHGVVLVPDSGPACGVRDNSGRILGVKGFIYLEYPNPPPPTSTSPIHRTKQSCFCATGKSSSSSSFDDDEVLDEHTPTVMDYVVKGAAWAGLLTVFGSLLWSLKK